MNTHMSLLLGFLLGHILSWTRVCRPRHPVSREGREAAKGTLMELGFSCQVSS